MTQTQAKTFRDFVNDAKSRIHEISQDNFRQWLENGKDMCVIDVREANDHSHGRIEGAYEYPTGVIELEIEDTVPNRDKTIVVYCGGGSRSALVADVLQQMGYTDVYSLTGGYREWNDKPEGLKPVEYNQ